MLSGICRLLKTDAQTEPNTPQEPSNYWQRIKGNSTAISSPLSHAQLPFYIIHCLVVCLQSFLVSDTFSNQSSSSDTTGVSNCLLGARPRLTLHHTLIPRVVLFNGMNGNNEAEVRKVLESNNWAWQQWSIPVLCYSYTVLAHSIRLLYWLRCGSPGGSYWLSSSVCEYCCYLGSFCCCIAPVIEINLPYSDFGTHSLLCWSWTPGGSTSFMSGGALT